MQLELEDLRASCRMAFHVKVRRGWVVPHAKNPYAALWYIHRGTLLLNLTGESLRISKGSIVLIPPDITYRVQLNEDVEDARIVVVRFDLTFKQAFKQELNWLALFKTPLVVAIQATRHEKKLLLDICQAELRPLPFWKLRQNGSLAILLSLLLQENERNIALNERSRNKNELHVFRVVRWMEENMAGKATLNDLAALIPLSVEHLIALFNDVLDDSPMHYRNRLRIAKAKELLQWTDHSVRNIAEQVGFADPLYFSRVFRRTEGVSPSQYRHLPNSPLTKAWPCGASAAASRN
jgi:AraC-like DNA-binding protein